MFITIALTGGTTEPNARKSSTNVARNVSSAIRRRVPPLLFGVPLPGLDDGRFDASPMFELTVRDLAHLIGLEYPDPDA